MSAAADEPFAAPEQQRGAALFGMAIFLASETLLFGALLAAMLFYRFLHPAEFVQASKALHLWLGALNTVVLLASSFLAAVAVAAARHGRHRVTARLLAGTAALGLAFLAVKAVEYGWEVAEGRFPLPGSDANLATPVERLFADLYLVATALHALHLTVGIVLLSGLAVRIHLKRLELPGRAVAVEVPVLYWHLVDVVWVFLYPALYLAR